MADATVHIDWPAVDFEKWQALGNDYLIVEQAALPFELTAARIRKLCAGHTGVFADGILLLSEPDAAGFVARLRIFNPDGSEAELSGNGAREAVLYLRRRGWTEHDSFSIQTAAGEIRPTITSASTCRLDLGRVRLRSDDYPAGRDDGIGVLSADGRDWSFQHVQVGNPQCAIRVAGAARARGARPAGDRTGDRASRAVSQPHQRVLVRAARARPDPRPDLRARGGGDLGQRHRRHRRRRRPRARGR